MVCAETEQRDGHGKPLASIIIPAFNAEKHIIECLESLTVQSYESIEVVVVNDGSSDRTAELCRTYSKSDARVFVVNQENSGSSAARRLGVECAHGAFYLFVDSDDRVVPTYVERIVTAFQAMDADMVAMNIVPFDERGGLPKSCIGLKDFPEGQYCNGLDCLSYIYERRLGHYMCSFAYRADFFKRLNNPLPDDLSLFEDVRLAEMALREAERVALVPQQVYEYRQHDESLVSTVKKENLLGALDALRDVRELNRVSEAQQNYYNCMIDSYFHIYTLSVQGHLSLKNEKRMVKREIFDFAGSCPRGCFVLKSRVKLAMLKLGLFDVLILSRLLLAKIKAPLVVRV